MRQIVQRLDVGEAKARSAVPMTEEQVYAFIWTEIRNWEPSSEVRWLKNGQFPLVLTAAGCAFAINSKFRRFFKLGYNAIKSSYCATVIPPAMLSFTLHTATVTDMLLGTTPCPVCIQTRAISLQAIAGCIYPMFISPFICASVAVPRALAPSMLIKENVLATLKYIYKRPNLFWAALVINCAVAGVVTYFEQEAAWKVQLKLSLDREPKDTRVDL